jgi:hypothetical protein
MVMVVVGLTDVISMKQTLKLQQNCRQNKRVQYRETIWQHSDRRKQDWAFDLTIKKRFMKQVVE